MSESSERDLQSVLGLSALLRVRGIGPKKALQLALVAGSAEHLHGMSRDEIGQVAGKPVADALFRKRLDLEEPRLPPDVWVLSYFDDAYPPGLRSLDDAPPLLWGIGSLPVPESVAIIGTRHPTAWSSDVAKVISHGAVVNGLAVVSGLALGIDSLAHEACLDAGGVTTAVLGNGVDAPYPASNRRLADRIVESGGGLLAEVAPGTRVDRGALVARDRLQAALSLATIVVQSGIPGGTLHTARFTLEQGRTLVVAMPNGSPKPEPYAGNLALADPAGADPAVLKATGALAARLAAKRPLADAVVSSAADLVEVWDLVRTHAGLAGEGGRCRAESNIGSWPSTSTEPSVTLQLSLQDGDPPPTSSG